MRKNILGISFLIIVAFFALWFVLKAAFAIFGYYQLSVQVPTKIEKWSIEEIKSDKFAILAHFTYEYQGKIFHSSGQVGNLYPNPWAANQAQKQIASEARQAWLNPKRPERAVLEKKFPFKQAVSAGILIALFIYFSILGTYIRIKHGR